MMTELTFFGKQAKFHHVGLAVESITAVSPTAEIFQEQTQKVSLAFTDLGGIRIELLEPLGDNSPIVKSLRDGVKLLHLCYEVPDLDAAVEEGRAAGFHRISRAVAAPVFGNRRVVWLYSKQFGLFELVEANLVTESPIGESDTPAILSFGQEG